MAYMSQEHKKEIVALAKHVLKKYGVKATFAVDNRLAVVCNIKSGKIDFIGNYNEMAGKEYFHNPLWQKAENYISVNPYHYDKHFSGDALAFLKALFTVMNEGNHDNSDIQTDYFDVGWYVRVNIGKSDKPYILEA